MSTLSSANVTDINLILKERTHVRLCVNMLIFTHNLGNWLIGDYRTDQLTTWYTHTTDIFSVCETNKRMYLHINIPIQQLQCSTLKRSMFPSN